MSVIVPIYFVAFTFLAAGILGVIYVVKDLLKENARAKKARESGNRAETK